MPAKSQWSEVVDYRGVPLRRQTSWPKHYQFYLHRQLNDEATLERAQRRVDNFLDHGHHDTLSCDCQEVSLSLREVTGRAQEPAPEYARPVIIGPCADCTTETGRTTCRHCGTFYSTTDVSVQTRDLGYCPTCDSRRWFNHFCDRCHHWVDDGVCTAVFGTSRS